MKSTTISNSEKCSIIIVTYNSSNHILKLLSSLKSSQKYIEGVVIIENNSPDKIITERLIEDFKRKSRNSLSIHFILESENMGFAKSCNKGAKFSKAENILFLNPDTELSKDSLSILLSHKKVTRAKLIGGKAVNYEGRMHGSAVRKPTLYIGLFEFSNLGKLLKSNTAHRLFYYEDINIKNFYKDKKVDAISGAYLLLSRKTFNMLNGFDENFFMYLEDVDLGKRAGDLDLKVVYCPHSVIKHVGGASSSNKYKIRHEAWFKSRRYYYKKHFGILVNIIIQPIFVIEEKLLKLIKKL